jgi:predicted AAA+ superfamily ATPase
VRIIERSLVPALTRRLRGGPNLLQIVVGPRQVGKTTAIRQVADAWAGPSHYASADLPAPPDAAWVQAQWEVARVEARSGQGTALLVLDEVQKVERWADVVKGLFEEDRHERRRLRVVLLGSSSLDVQQGAHESLAGRFELHFSPHWSWSECREAFGWTLDQWLYYGGYPGAARLVRSHDRWSAYVADSLVESVLSRDVLQMAAVSKPALLRQLFMLAVRSPARIVAYNKMLGQLHDAGNTVTLAHYLELLSRAFLVSGVGQFTAGVLRSRASSPKLIAWNDALVTSLSGLSFGQARRQTELWGRLVENAVGAHLLNLAGPGQRLHYWREGDDEVDFVLESGQKVLGLEVKSGRPRTTTGLQAFLRRHPGAKSLIVGSGGLSFEKFFSRDPWTLAS